MSKKIIVLCLILLMNLSVLAHEHQSPNFAELQSLLHSLENKTIPAPGNKYFSDERVAIDVTMASGQIHKEGIVVEKAVVTKVVSKEIDTPTITVQTSEQVIQNIAASEDPLQAAKEAYLGKEIIIHAKSFKTKLKLALLRWGLRLA